MARLKKTSAVLDTARKRLSGLKSITPTADRRANFYEAGSGQEVIRVDWFTLLFKVTRVSHRGGGLLFVASVNGATKLILNREVCPQVDARAFRHLNHSEPSL